MADRVFFLKGQNPFLARTIFDFDLSQLSKKINRGLKWKTDTLCCDSVFRNKVLVIANACPEKHGIVVNKARALYNIITKTNTVFTNGCSSGSGSRIINTDNTIENTNEVLENKTIDIVKIKVSPNPNNGSFIIYFDAAIASELTVKLSNAQGNVVYAALHKIENGNISINTSNLAAGIYLLEVRDNKQIFEIQKVVIQKNN
jgi:hypothetical protein